MKYIAWKRPIRKNEEPRAALLAAEPFTGWARHGYYAHKEIPPEDRMLPLDDLKKKYPAPPYQ
jgi:hypothetical protein